MLVSPNPDRAHLRVVGQGFPELRERHEEFPCRAAEFWHVLLRLLVLSPGARFRKLSEAGLDEGQLRAEVFGGGVFATAGQQLERGRALRVGPQHVNFNGRCHGGAIFSLADMALGLACNSWGTIAALIDANISLSAGVEQGSWIIARAVEVSRSRKIATYRVDVTRADNGSHIASVSGTVYRSDKPVVVSA